MKKIILWLGCITAMFAFTCTYAANIEWHEMSDSDFVMAKNQKKLVLLLAKSDACHWCQQMKSVTLSDPKVIKTINKNYIPVMVDVDQNRDAIKKYKITSLPTIIIFDASHNVVQVIAGYVEPQELLNSLNK